MQIVYLVNGLGEYAQAYGIADKLRFRKYGISFFTESLFLTEIIKKDQFFVTRFDEEKESLQEILDRENCDVLFLCNSHTTTKYQLERPKKVGLVCSLDSNWLFNNSLYEKLGEKRFRTYEWIDKIFAVFPRSLFEKNLKENGGYFEIEPFFRQKIITPGFIPSGRKIDSAKTAIRKLFGLKDADKLVVTYFARRDFHKASIRNYIESFENSVLQAVKRMEVKGEIKVINLSSLRSNYAFSFTENFLATDDFDNFLLAADLVIMHFGYGTLPKLFNNQIPIVSLVSEPEGEKFPGFYELKPCIERGAVDYLFYKDMTLESITNKLKTYLYDSDAIKRMKENQKAIFSPGEENVIREIESYA